MRSSTLVLSALVALSSVGLAAKNDSTCSQSVAHSEQLLTPDIANNSDVYAAAGSGVYAVAWIQDGYVRIAQNYGSIDLSEESFILNPTPNNTIPNNGTTNGTTNGTIIGSTNGTTNGTINGTTNGTINVASAPKLVVFSASELLAIYTSGSAVYSHTVSLPDNVVGEQVLVANGSEYTSSFLIRQGSADSDANTFFCGQVSEGNGSVECFSTTDGSAWEAVDTDSFVEASGISATSPLAAATNDEGQVLVVYSVNETTLGAATLDVDAGLQVVASEIPVDNSELSEELGNYVLSLTSSGADAFALAASSASGVHVALSDDFGVTWSEPELVVEPTGETVSRISFAFTDKYVLAYEDEDGVSAIVKEVAWQYNDTNATYAPTLFGYNSTSSPSLIGGNVTSAPSTIGANATRSPTLFGGVNVTSAPSTIGVNGTRSPTTIGGVNATRSPTTIGGVNATRSPTTIGGVNATRSPTTIGGVNGTRSPTILGGGNATRSPTLFGGVNVTASPTSFGANGTASPSSPVDEFAWSEPVGLLDGATRPVLAAVDNGAFGYILAALTPPTDVVAIGCFSEPASTESPSEYEYEGSLVPSAAPTKFTSGNSTKTPTSIVITTPPALNSPPPGASDASQRWSGIGAALSILALSLTLTLA